MYDNHGDEMNREKTKQIVTGAFMAALFGVLSVVNVYTGTMFDIIFIYLMTVALAYYTFKFNEKMAVLVLFTSTFILFLTGELFFTLYSFFTLPLGILYIYCLKKNIDGKWILRVYSMLKNYIVLFLLNSLLGLNTFTDAKDIYYSIVGLFPFLESDFLKNGMFIILWIVLSFSEVYIIKVYTNLFIRYRICISFINLYVFTKSCYFSFNDLYFNKKCCLYHCSLLSP